MLTIDLKPGKYNPQRIKIYGTPSSYSLNRNKRIRELTRMTHENKMLLQRLQSAQSTYDRTKIPVQKLPKPYEKLSNEPRIMSAVGGRSFGYKTMVIKQRRAKSSYAVARKTKKRKKRVMTAGYVGRKRSAARKTAQAIRPITAKGPNVGRRNNSAKHNNQEEEDNGFRPDTVPFTNIGPLGATEPQDGDDKIKQEITREVTGESEKEIEARIGEEEEVSKESENEEKPVEDKFNEKEKQLDNLSEDISNNHDNEESSKNDEEKEVAKQDENPKLENDKKDHQEQHHYDEKVEKDNSRNKDSSKDDDQEDHKESESDQSKPQDKDDKKSKSESKSQLEAEEKSDSKE